MKVVYQRYIKRAIDIIFSLIGMILLSPIYLLLSILIFIDDPGPVIFTQKRFGKNRNGEAAFFQLYKFRSMKMATPHDTPTHLLEDPHKYITKIGAFLRKSSLDEIPQLWNIFKGDMSIVGPRPGLWNQDDLYAERERYGANDVVPGLTGWAQVNGRDALSLEEKARRDGDYAKNLTFKMDLTCFLMTISQVMRQSGVVEGGTGALAKAIENRNNEINKMD